MKNYIPKWHKELEIFAKIKPLIILEGNILDSYLYPVNGSTPIGSIVPNLSQYLFYLFQDMGYKNIVFYDNLNGFYGKDIEKENASMKKFKEVLQIEDNNIKNDFACKNTNKDKTAPFLINEFLSKIRLCQ